MTEFILLMKMEKEYRFKKESLDSLLEEIDKIYEEAKTGDKRINLFTIFAH